MQTAFYCIALSFILLPLYLEPVPVVVVSDAIDLEYFVDADLLQRLYHVPVGQVLGQRHMSVGVTKSQVWKQ